MTQPLSPAAQAIWEAFNEASDGHYEDGVWTPHTSTQIAAALRALADQVMPATTDARLSIVRFDICRIAAELEGGQ